MSTLPLNALLIVVHRWPIERAETVHFKMKRIFHTEFMNMTADEDY